MPAEKRKRVYDPVKRRQWYQAAKARAQAEGFTSPSAKQRFRKVAAANPSLTLTEYRKRRALVKFNVSEKTFNAMRSANIGHTPEGFRKDGKPLTHLAYVIQTYNTDVDFRENDWSDERVGYITSYYWAVANPATNYFSSSDSERVIQANRFPLPADYRNWIARQYLYLVRYGGLSIDGELMDGDEFAERYGDGGPISQKILSGDVRVIRPSR